MWKFFNFWLTTPINRLFRLRPRNSTNSLIYLVFLQSVLLSLGWFYTLPLRAEADHQVRIGVMAVRGAEITQQTWRPTALYLTEANPGYVFQIVPLNNDTLVRAVREQTVDFVLSNPASYASLEATDGISRIATLKNHHHGETYTQFGAIIFTRADNHISRLQD